MVDKHKFLHGTLEATICHATLRRTSFRLGCMPRNRRSTYVTIKMDNKKVAQTSHARDCVWNQTFQILCAHPSDAKITITLKTKCTILGKIEIQAHQLLNQESLIEGLFPLNVDKSKRKRKHKLQFILWFKSAENEPSWQKVIGNGGFQGLRTATFQLRSNCRVLLYQDAHHKPTFQPPSFSNETPRKLWEDVFRAIEGAKHLIYIAAWSLNPKLVLVRDSQTVMPHAKGVKLGELLKRKAEEGVAVRIMLWHDETCLPMIKNKGVMSTHDEDAESYFKNTKVICKLFPRLHDKFPTFFTHHQKTITVDTRGHSSSTNREILSFLGGLDLCDGRYDTEEHSLFKTLNTESHCFDFYQTSISGATLHKGGPREPWHDTHACVTGQAAWDILTNFEQRWTKQSDPSLLIPISSIPQLSNQANFDNNFLETDWKVQVFRSIDHVSATPLPRNIGIEKSIHEAYVEAIRRADRFIYVENQYFIGGCHLWDTDHHCGCTNLIPVEIALKIIQKIRAKERFAVYIVIPMWPEGLPESESVQDILHWTRQTMKMMYKLIGEAIQESGDSLHPKDYLNFFCLANREKQEKGEFNPPYSPHQGSPYWNTQKSRRFMVYVHSKLMIVDDAYIMIGSANINQRSMDGSRDTEIAVGCYQTKTKQQSYIDESEIHAFRLSLWYEHTGQGQEFMKQPQSLECVQRIRSLGDKMWQIYNADEIVDMKGVHLVSYPVNVTEKGYVEEVDEEGGGHFPDTNASIKGKRAIVLATSLTT
ncbi:hypothetical protein Leryth_005143 [Lithospermum erythrorhizon]|nr:hypothetical protein Leryth_005143 [Lithospermum erythrorhizon]